ncbi:Os02g0809300 [Oryza sativa Japonica Group]|uniref:Os02g0809300 protein n=2 Tax=Oryza sativa subsp. japonica TaxID=39947 RepID=Q6KA82_ORYSJ|nr:hypothetical protein EE612_014374 [Oryza sativa]KAF2947545.1 hypothetical protein DAI22_02g377000 [Oryza sativa Japonica Group]BAD19138.1 unknown protein [Oryza sativa Japonica Group]BAD19253.1 unknown protein [Oryza sativa Japonica Group]BAF10376.1 Os02g0809300 [Oryza sativa Japonica Group]|eukprot:NP_001048462.1 Os02g0809300 [Oryza sativa Japonica Group]
MARARWIGDGRRPAAALPLLGLCAFLCAVMLVVSLAPPPGEEEEEAKVRSSSLPAAATSVPAGGRRLLLPAARTRRFRPRRWNSAGIDDSKHEVPSGPNPDSNR